MNFRVRQYSWTVAELLKIFFQLIPAIVTQNTNKTTDAICFEILFKMELSFKSVRLARSKK
jgi:hypothetical protein